VKPVTNVFFLLAKNPILKKENVPLRQKLVDVDRKFCSFYSMT